MDPYSWSLHAEVIVFLPLLALGYALAVRREPPPGWRVASLLCALTMIAFAFVTPLETISLHFLLTAHFLQNVVLAEWAPALCVLALPPATAARLEGARLLQLVTRPLVALPLWLGTYFAWHIPAVYDYALRRPATVLHLEHLCYLVAGLVLWWAPLTGRLRAGLAAGYLFAAFVLASPLGLLLALLPHPAYNFYERAPRLWGLSATADQQIAGLTMAAEQAIVFFAAFAYFFLRFLREEDAAVAFDR